MNIFEMKPFVRNITLTDSEINYENKFYYDCQLIFISKGEAELKTKDTVYKMKRGSVAVIRCGEIHSFNIDASSSAIIVHFDYTSRFSTFKSYSLPLMNEESFNVKKLISPVEFNDALCLNGNLFIENIAVIEQDLLKMYSEYDKKYLMFTSKLSHSLSSVIIDIVRNIDSIQSEDNMSNKLKTIKAVINYINDNYTLPINSKSISKIFPYNPNYLNSLIKENTGYSICSYIIICRLSQAMFLLQQSNMNITEIANTVGFKEPSHFSKYFKKYIGVSPQKYKETRNNLQSDKQEGV